MKTNEGAVALTQATRLAPLSEFSMWQQEALAAGDAMADCFVLATVGAGARPSARVVSYRPGPKGEFRFYTNYHSRKGRELEANAAVAAVFVWRTQGRQVRFEGHAVQIGWPASSEYFASRPLEHQVASVLSAQSSALDSISDLRQRHARLVHEHRARGTAPPCPEHWGGYELEATRIELWERNSFRLPERRCYVRSGPCFSLQRLFP